jgi:drug/metabolite transporter (DMT)-like permease
MKLRISALFAPLFVLIWSTGFIIARYGMPYSEPMTFLFLRFTGVLLCLTPVIIWLKPPWPDRKQILHIGVAGALFQFGYLGGVWVAVKLGMPAGLASLIVGLQPILTAVLASFVAERVSARQWLGLVFGLTGVTMVLAAKIKLDGLSWFPITMAVTGLVCITLGTLYQKHYCKQFDLRTGSFIQFAVASLLCLLAALLFETREVQWTAPMIGALLWGIGPISIGAMTLWFILLRHGEATKVSSVMYLTPPTTALMAWLLFNEQLSALILGGIIITMFGVLIVNQTSLPKWAQWPAKK